MCRAKAVKRRGARRRTVRGAVLIEVVMMAALALVICTVLARVVATSWTLGKVTANKAGLQTRSRRAMTLLQDDIQSSASILPSYGPYQASHSTLLLSAPAYDGAFEQIAGANDTIIYRLVGVGVPYSLHRQVIVAPGSARPAMPDTAIAGDISSLQFSYLFEQKSTGTGLPVITLLLVNVGANAFVASHLGLPPPTVLVDGAVRGDGVSVSGTAANITPAPPLGAQIALFFPVDPSPLVDQTKVSAVFVTLGASVTDSSLRTAQTQTLLLNGGGVLRNH